MRFVFHHENFCGGQASSGEELLVAHFVRYCRRVAASVGERPPCRKRD